MQTPTYSIATMCQGNHKEFPISKEALDPILILYVARRRGELIMEQLAMGLTTKLTTFFERTTAMVVE